MIKGLDEAAKRAEALELREEARRKAGGKTINMALHVDDTGRRWARNVILFILGVSTLVVAGAGAMMYISNRTVISPRAGDEDAKTQLWEIEARAQSIKFSEGEQITAQSAKDRIAAKIQDELKNIEDQIDRDRKSGRPLDQRNSKTHQMLLKLTKFQDAWSQPFTFEMADKDTLKISAKGKPLDGKADAIPPVTVPMRSGAKAAAPKTAHAEAPR